METKASQAVEGAKDAKFLRERQLILNLVEKIFWVFAKDSIKLYLWPLGLPFRVLFFVFAIAHYSDAGKLLHGSRTGCLQSVSSSKLPTRWQVA